MPDRREFLIAAAGSALANSVLAAATVEDKGKLPLVSKRLEKAFLAPGKMPNGLQVSLNIDTQLPSSLPTRDLLCDSSTVQAYHQH